MIWIILISLGLVSSAIGASILLFRKLQAAKKQVKAYQASDAKLRAELAAREKIINRMEEANRDAAKKKDSLHHGSNRERFDASLRVLRDVPGSAGADRTVKDKD